MNITDNCFFLFWCSRVSAGTGGKVTITAGVTIGDNAVIGAGSVVESDIPANAIAVGQPARVIRKIQQNTQ